MFHIAILFGFLLWDIGAYKICGALLGVHIIGVDFLLLGLLGNLSHIFGHVDGRHDQ